VFKLKKMVDLLAENGKSTIKCCCDWKGRGRMSCVEMGGCLLVAD
jgi:hypothetical protein